MKSLLLSLSLLIIMGSNSWGNDSIRNYNHYINSANLALVDGDLFQAQKGFEMAFEYKKPNARDLKNAALVNYFLEDSLLTKSYVNMALGYGADLVFEQEFDNPHFYQWVHQDKEALHKKWQGSKTQQYAQILENFIKESWLENFHDLNTEEQVIFRKKRATLIKEIYKQYGFPNIENAGMKAENYALRIKSLVHNDEEIDKIYLIAVKEGYISSLDWMGALNRERLFAQSNPTYRMYDNYENLHFFDWTYRDSVFTDSLSINQKRKELLLPSIEDYYKLYRYAFNRHVAIIRYHQNNSSTRTIHEILKTQPFEILSDDLMEIFY